MNSSEKRVSILDRIESFGERIGLIQKVTPLVEVDELRKLKAKGDLVWPVPLTLDHSHVFAHCIELQFEDEEDADQFFAMYSDAMGGAAHPARTVLTDELIFDALKSVDPTAVRLPPGFEAFARAIIAATEAK